MFCIPVQYIAMKKIINSCIVILFLVNACNLGMTHSSYEVLLPELPEFWEEILGEAHCRLEWLDRQGFWKALDLAPNEAMPGLSIIEERSNPVYAWPYWPSRKLFPGLMHPAGAVYPWDISNGVINFSWRAGIEAVFWEEMAAAERASTAQEARLPWYFDWPRFRTLLLTGSIPESVKQNPWTADWKDIAQRTIQSGFLSSRIRSKETKEISIQLNDPGGRWINSSAFSSPIYTDQDGMLILTVTETPDIWVSEGGMIKASTAGWVYISD